MAQRLLLLAMMVTSLTDAFMLVLPPLQHARPAVVQQQRSLTIDRSSCLLQMAGFGGDGGASKKKKDKTIKLKPKAQWDSYKDLKKEEAVRVAVRRVRTKMFYQVGAIKSKNNAHPEAAVLAHKVLIADHARRIFPVQLPKKDRLEWAYCASTATQDDDWVILDVNAVAPVEGIDKKSGFEGLADPTGLYAIRTVKNVDVS
jgi:hypothetical protein